jgi:integrative and conjugative element protein (TIGR02256 family)
MRVVQPARVWLSDTALAGMQAEAARYDPDETGGMLLGWEDPDKQELVIAQTLGPGPNADHRRVTFRPDADWQQHELERIYLATDGKLTFLGDWHVHPAGGLGLSRRDRKTMAKVAVTEEARCPHPVTVLLAGEPEGTYQLGAWVWSPRTWPWVYGQVTEIPLCVWTTDETDRFWEHLS